jgi:hypothetical protein
VGHDEVEAVAGAQGGFQEHDIVGLVVQQRGGAAAGVGDGELFEATGEDRTALMLEVAQSGGFVVEGEDFHGEWISG